jgi:hypothetical protein
VKNSRIGGGRRGGGRKIEIEIEIEIDKFKKTA